ncbi:MAG: hypothetical protein A2896_02140 [Candidatus Nealsonbacteria bacterium RIFCSPLOWO2_01_FULL_43_32]|uniref:GlcNAc-PI de-N-acetylase n=1 Tax=Candidatus Nealsonbacteria bacterium RIFCSPLOWO2_01_FULL_43_32 TaxID=1801672 RepID=A0A1G2EGL5_9BACT|nr:MAG: hypothetical protein A2896_02140 [Candidatus Nealsonbacteria bacterium RIFCSPLOWO2_01_FULL_43_32]
MSQKFLVFSAHPDDADFGCSGTVAQLVKEGNEVVYCIVSNGEKGTHKVKVSRQAIISLREKEQRAAAGILGVKKVVFLNEKDGEVENTKALRKKIVKVIRQCRPDVVLSFDPVNLVFDNFRRYHRDHRQAAEAVFDAIFPAAGSDAFFKELKIKPHTIKEAWFFASHSPNLWIDISKTINKKIEALLAHASQISSEKELRKKISGWAKETGQEKHLKYAEKFRKLELL